MLYLDSSSLLKTLWEEPESPAVRDAIGREERIVVSVLAELETEVQLRARRLGGGLTKRRYDAYRAASLPWQAALPNARSATSGGDERVGAALSDDQ